VFFALAGEESLGMIAADIEGGVAHTRALWVEPRWRGKGVANALLDGVETWAHDVRAQRMELSVAERHEGAIRLYKRRHYQESGRLIPTRFGHRELVLSKPVGF
jgi:GNAT superfamily N-acetyltransferase